MTAAVAPAASNRPAPTGDSHTRPVSPVPQSGPEAVIASRRRSARAPYLAPVPACEPPFDDELDGRHGTGARADRSRVLPVGRLVATPLPPARQADPAPPATTAAPQPAVAPNARGLPHSSVVAGTLAPRATATAAMAKATAQTRKSGPTSITAAGVPQWSSEADIGVRRTGTQQLPAAQRAASVLARALVEVLSGRRPTAQLRVHCAPDIYAGLLERPFLGHQALPHLISVRVCEPADGVAEVSAVFRRADRVRAMAFRIQGVDGRWRITALQLG